MQAKKDRFEVKYDIKVVDPKSTEYNVLKPMTRTFYSYNKAREFIKNSRNKSKENSGYVIVNTPFVECC